ncbi:hypothetical protein GTV15_20705 [Streptomyces sp. SID7803]|nr:hypothetical protein [Streptomyces sp. SID7803]
MTVIGTLFHRRADLALKHMESQTQSLRLDMKVERDAGQAIRLLEDVDDPRAQGPSASRADPQVLRREASGAERSAQAGQHFGGTSVSGAVPQQQSESAAS